MERSDSFECYGPTIDALFHQVACLAVGASNSSQSEDTISSADLIQTLIALKVIGQPDVPQLLRAIVEVWQHR